MRVNQDNPSKTAQYIFLVIKTENPKTVEQLVELVQSKYSLPRKVVIDEILQLQNQGNLSFTKNSVLPATPKDLVLTTDSLWYWIVMALTFIITVFVLVTPAYPLPFVYARYILGSLFVLLLPGYSLVKALFPTRELDNFERTALSIGISLALVPILSLFLNYTPWGIRDTSITLSLLIVTAVFATIAIIRERSHTN